MLSTLEKYGYNCVHAKLAVMTLLLPLQGELHIVVGPVGAGKVM